MWSCEPVVVVVVVVYAFQYYFLSLSLFFFVFFCFTFISADFLTLQCMQIYTRKHTVKIKNNETTNKMRCLILYYILCMDVCVCSQFVCRYTYSFHVSLSRSVLRFLPFSVYIYVFYYRKFFRWRSISSWICFGFVIFINLSWFERAFYINTGNAFYIVQHLILWNSQPNRLF